MSKTKINIEKYVKEWMDGHEPDTFIKNDHGVYLYSSGPVSLNLKVFFESLLEDFIEENTAISDREDEMKEILETYIKEFKAFNFSAENVKRAEQILKELS